MCDLFLGPGNVRVIVRTFVSAERIKEPQKVKQAVALAEVFAGNGVFICAHPQTNRTVFFIMNVVFGS